MNILVHITVDIYGLTGTVSIGIFLSYFVPSWTAETTQLLVVKVLVVKIATKIVLTESKLNTSLTRQVYNLFRDLLN